VIGESRVSYAIPFGSLSYGGHAYLLPSAFSVQRTGFCSLHRSMGRNVTDLKMRILDKRCGLEDETEIAAFLALVFKHGRAWLLKEHADIYRNLALDWVINVGLPTDSFHDDQLIDIYRRLTKSGWDLSLDERPISLERAKEAISRTKEDTTPIDSGAIGIDASKVSTFPEFVAQITGYVRSSRRTTGLHCLVDVGAGTLDVTLFNVWQGTDKADRYPIFGRFVKRLGTSYLCRRRAREANARLTLSPFENLPSDREFAARLNIELDRLHEIDRKFNDGVRESVMQLLRDTRQNHMPKASDWKSVPLFLCGGGGRAEFYSRLLADMCRRSQAFNLGLKRLPRPERLEAPLIGDQDVDRLSVAYGLSFEPLDVGEIIRQNNIPNVPGPPADDDPTGYKRGFVGPEHV
jgi:hypothetical protein